MDYLITILGFAAVYFFCKWIQEKRDHKKTWKHHLEALDYLKETR